MASFDYTIEEHKQSYSYNKGQKSSGSKYESGS